MIKKPVESDPKPLLGRIKDRIKMGQVGLAIVRRLKRHLTLRNFWLINKLPVEALKLSEMLIKVLYSQPTDIVCDRLTKVGEITFTGDFTACCRDLVPPFGNVFNADLERLYNGYRARIIKLSALNHTYCLCDFNKCQMVKRAATIAYTPDLAATPAYPRDLTLATDKTCNLKCGSCRLTFLTANDAENKRIKEIHNRLLGSGWLSKIDHLIIAGMGEAFYSPHYLSLLTNDLQRKQINITTNGLLFTPQKWEQIKDKYQVFDVRVSIDAASATTYRKVRGGDFKLLLKNLNFLSELRQQNKIHYLQLNFVVQRSNYQEMADFVRLGKQLRVDLVYFSRLGNWGTMKLKHYRQNCLVVKNKYLTRDLYAILQDPIFNDPIVDIGSFNDCLANSAKRYGE